VGAVALIDIAAEGGAPPGVVEAAAIVEGHPVADLGLVLVFSVFLHDHLSGAALPSLVVCPASLVYNWEEEIERFAPELITRLLVGSRDERKKQIDNYKDVDVLITRAEQMLGMDPATGEPIPRCAHDCIMRHLVQRGYVTASADSYHITYMESEKPFDDFSRWKDAGEKLRCDHPNWSGVGKLISDTQLLLDALCADKRVDSSRVGIAGHSLGGKMAFYTGCLDSRVKAILASDFGIGWDQTNWRDVWY